MTLSDTAERKKYVDEVWDVLQSSYSKIGGIKGTGFGSKSEMVQRIPFWKIAVVNSEIVAVVMYKDKAGRKSVAVGTNRTGQGKRKLKEMLAADLTRSWGEQSHDLLRFVKREMPDLLKKYAIPAETVVKLLGKKGATVELIPGEKYKYIRNINGNKIEKEAYGTPGKTIIMR